MGAERIAVEDADIVAMILRHEGSIYTDHPADRGGPTRHGITIPVLSHYRGYECSASDIKNLSQDEAAAIYQRNYIKPFASMGITLFRANVIDMGVNAGVMRAIRLMQQTVRADVDGRIGPKTIAAATSRDWNLIFVGVRIAFYERIIENNASQIVWRNGWHNRALWFDSRQRQALPLRMDGGSPIFGPTGKAYL